MLNTDSIPFNKLYNDNDDDDDGDGGGGGSGDDDNNFDDDIMKNLFFLTDSSIDAPPSFKPSKKYADLSGLPVSF